MPQYFFQAIYQNVYMNVVSDKNVVTSTVKHLGQVDTDQERGKIIGRMERPRTLSCPLSVVTLCFLSGYLDV
jgi:hypothetical protein